MRPATDAGRFYRPSRRLSDARRKVTAATRRYKSQKCPRAAGPAPIGASDADRARLWFVRQRHSGGWTGKRLMNDELIQRIRQCPNLPSLPAIAMQVLELAQKPDADIAEIARIICKDPAMSSKL